MANKDTETPIEPQVDYRDKDGYLLQTHWEFPLELIKAALEYWEAPPKKDGYVSGLCAYFWGEHGINCNLTTRMLRQAGVLSEDRAFLGHIRHPEPRIKALKELLKQNKGRSHIQTRRPIKNKTIQEVPKKHNWEE